MTGFTLSDWVGTASVSAPPTSGSIPKTESLRAHMDGGNAGGTRSQTAANANSGDRALLYWEAGIIIGALIILWVMGAMSMPAVG